uniref:Uncharacterized protein n=1 Tax=Paramoeba aestuarina TaxID=180227 RepID=A0A7S4NUB6_9EUKA|mmetsp:Transcript_28716/g.44438  ORF Transcript_28716/g.44438 Transcript_28716/m.44438 type:complete len:100 (+) Transcript_28716:665-964(+)|eukprot:CAMPEP_0201519304 /NCGR_PEP_ID=MMETSP0161_2-20130828/9889_1 /ASSEMBLY_ACC=CAM_ASM_000251 /TAXON_ID=180227 /ORGANISM="Neoparamoeba aestuarina, Strain SoJaBio B1-5/56/2" /LENGTH=99 /DNA_ID=CAMNT_0047917299 /DNA_START=640 /DNA_END=939 /DNA_ORIENTATION=-
MANEYTAVRANFHALLHLQQLTETRNNTIEVVRNGAVQRNLGGYSGVSTYRRQDGTKICEQSFYGGTTNGCARYFNEAEELVGEDYSTGGGVIETRVFQ